MKKIVLAVGSLLFLTGCAQGQSSEAACELLISYTGEISTTLNRMTDNISDASVRKIGVENLNRVLSEVEDKLDPSDPELKEVAGLWISTQRDLYELYEVDSLAQLNSDEVTTANEMYQMVIPRLSRLCEPYN